MSTVVLADSRLKGIEKDPNFPPSFFTFNVKSGSRIKDHKQFVKRLGREHRAYNLFIIAVGINDIPDDIADKTDNCVNKLLTKVTSKYHVLCRTIKKSNSNAQIVIATIPPKHLLRSIQKYPQKSPIDVQQVTDKHQSSFAQFLSRVNTYINDFNTRETGRHLPLHTNLRNHRGRRRTKFRYDKFTDGLHPSTELKRNWFNTILDLRQDLIG
ncbi:MAG: SGNH/GDSL hydrolase family protein [Sedimenticola sp.]